MESYLANLKQQVQCSLCKETLTDPKLTYCFHTFCKMCIKTNTQVDEGETNVFKCPQCDSQTLLQDLNDVEDLQTSPIHSKMLQVLEFVQSEKTCSVSAYHYRPLRHCIDCNQSLCEDCLRYHSKFTKNHQVVLLSNLSKEHIDMIMAKKESACKTHDDQDVQLYCKDCDVLVCLNCWKEDHYIHKVTSLEQLITVEKDDLSKNLEQIDKISTDEKEKIQQEQIALNIKVSGEKGKEKVKELTNMLVKALRDNEQQLLNEIDKSVSKSERNLRIIHHTAQAQVYINHFKENGTATEMFNARHGEWYQDFTFKPFEESISQIEFKPNKELCEQVKTGLGPVRFLTKADPKECLMRVEPSDLEARNKGKLVIELKTSRGESTSESLENVSIQFIPKDGLKVEEKHMTDDGEITVDFIPRVACQLTVDVQVHGKDISNSPLAMAVKPQKINEVTGHSKLKDALNTGSKNFSGIAVNKANSRIAIADWKEHCIRVYTMDGDLLLTYGSQGSEQDQLNGPHGLAFLDETDLVIADRFNHRICIVNTATGKLVRTFGCYGDSNGQFKEPFGVHVDDGENIMVCDNSNNRVQVFTKDGDYLYQCRVPSPFSIVTHNGLFYVSSTYSKVIHVIELNDNQSPTTVTTIGGEDYTDGRLQWHSGLAIDDDNNLLVCNYESNLIRKFTLDGRYVNQSRKLSGKPYYIAILKNGQAICNTGNVNGIILLENIQQANK